MRGLFITGTGTGVGKTFVAGGLVRWLRGRGVDAVPMKPVQTGCRRTPDGLVAPDLEWMLEAAGLRPEAAERGLMGPFRYEPACSPHLAGRLAGRYPDLDVIEQSARELAVAHDALVVEGAGGVLAPLDERRTMLDLMTRLALPVVVVAHAGLGTINHTLLTLNELRRAGLAVAGVILNAPEPPPAAGSEEAMIRQDNPAAIARLGQVEILGALAWQPDPGDWAAFEQSVPGLDCLLPRFQ